MTKWYFKVVRWLGLRSDRDVKQPGERFNILATCRLRLAIQNRPDIIMYFLADSALEKTLFQVLTHFMYLWLWVILKAIYIDRF